MEFSLKLKEIEKNNEIIEKENNFKIAIENSQEDFTIFLENDKPKYEDDLIEECYIKIGNLFKIIKISKINGNILNIKELIKKWENLKKEIVFNVEDEMLVQYILNNSKYYENYEALEFLLKNFSIIPFFRLLNFKDLKSNTEEKTLEVYNIVPEGKIDYKIKLNYSEELTGEKEITFKGERTSNFDIGIIKNIFRQKYNITKDKVFNLDTNIKGNYILEDDFIKEMNIYLTIDGGKYFVKEYAISMIRM